MLWKLQALCQKLEKKRNWTRNRKKNNANQIQKCHLQTATVRKGWGGGVGVIKVDGFITADPIPHVKYIQLIMTFIRF